MLRRSRCVLIFLKNKRNARERQDAFRFFFKHDICTSKINKHETCSIQIEITVVLSLFFILVGFKF